MDRIDKKNYYLDISMLNLNLDEVGEEKTIPYSATYFYYEGGYKSVDEKVFRPIDNEYFYSPSTWGMLTGGNTTTTYELTNIDIYDEGGNPLTGSGENGKFTIADIAKDWSETWSNNYYIADVSGIEEQSTKELYKVSNWYYVHGDTAEFTKGYYCELAKESGELTQYEITDRKPNPNSYKIVYMIDNSLAVNNDLLSTVLTRYYTSNGINYNANKYLANADHQIYTRYRFTDGDVSPFSNGIWLIENEGHNEAIPKYYLFNGTNAVPNSGSTYLVESVIVTFANNGNVIWTGEGQTESGINGQITIT